MRRVLMVGCGGSGAKTLAYMMDQLKADLANYGIEDIPGCWQFVNVDTPIQEESQEKLGVPQVSTQGGRYVPCGVKDSYEVVDAAISQRMGESGGLRKVATWMPRTPDSIQVNIEVGAGQLRGLGRLLILNKLDEVRRGLVGAVEAMQSADADAQAWRLSETFKAAGPPPAAGSSPVVFVVASMAGGSGSSMALDICRLLSEVPGVNSANISMFLYTAEIFKNLHSNDPKAGMPGNTLALLGEILAAQSSSRGEADRIDTDLYRNFGINAPVTRPFQAVIPVGLKISGGAELGDGTPGGVYRAMGRGLARFITAASLDDYVQYLAGNPEQAPAALWGLKSPMNSEVMWASFGYASLSMGRDLYGEYSAQRLARRAMDHAVLGHRLEDDDRGDEERLSSLRQARMVHELESLGLNAPVGVGESSTARWFSGQFDAPDLGARVKRVISEAFSSMPTVADGISPLRWASQVAKHLANASESATLQLEGVAQDEVRRWASRLADRAEDTVRQDLAELGIPYTLSLLRSVIGPEGTATVLQRSLVGLGRVTTLSPFSLPKTFQARVSAMGEKTVLQRVGMEQLSGRLADDLANQVSTEWLLPRMSTLAAAVLLDYAQGVVKPLVRALSDAVDSIELSQAAQPHAEGVAQVATEIYQSWPSEPVAGQSPAEAVPERFATAHNEVTLMAVDEFVPRFSIDVVESVRSELGSDGQDSTRLDASLTRVTKDVLLGDWSSEGGKNPPRDLLVRTRDWMPRGLALDAATATPVPAIYTLRVGTADVLARAREFVRRQGESFQVFCSQSLRSYLTDSQAGRTPDARTKQVAEAMSRALALARPLIDLDAAVHRKAYPNSNPSVVFRFSEVPFMDLPAGAAIRNRLKTDSDLDYQMTTMNLDQAGGNHPVTRVDIFGSYPLTIPATLSGLVKYVGEEWAKVQGSQNLRNGFWEYKRARPLPGVLPMSDPERKTMIRGWFAAILCGALKLPANSASRDATPVRIWDRKGRTWMDFPAPMLTTPREKRNEWLPAVLEAKLLAYLQVPVLGFPDAFRPYEVLRSYGDANFVPTMISSEREDWKLLQKLVVDGTIDPELRAPLGLAAKSEEGQRIEALSEAVQKLITNTREHYLPGSGSRDEVGFWTNFHSRDLVASTPLTIDIANEMVEELKVLQQVLDGIASVEPDEDEIGDY